MITALVLLSIFSLMVWAAACTYIYFINKQMMNALNEIKEQEYAYRVTVQEQHKIKDKLEKLTTSVEFMKGKR